MTWTFKYDSEMNETTVEWREFTETFDGKITSKTGGFPNHDGANDAVNSVLESINSIPVGLEAVAEFRPGMIEYTTVENGSS